MSSFSTGESSACLELMRLVPQTRTVSLWVAPEDFADARQRSRSEAVELQLLFADSQASGLAVCRCGRASACASCASAVGERKDLSPRFARNCASLI
eukprot:6203833-Pleurochrysis_carterae.AAC.4